MTFLKCFIFIAYTILLQSCCWECGEICGGETTIYERNFFCYVYDAKTKETVVGFCVNCPYSNEASVLSNEKGDTIRTENTIKKDGSMWIPLVVKDRDSIGYDIEQSYYLHLVDYQGIERDVDTIRFTFQLIKDDCRVMDFKDFRCYFNDSLYITEFPWHKAGGRVIFYK